MLLLLLSHPTPSYDVVPFTVQIMRTHSTTANVTRTKPFTGQVMRTVGKEIER